MYEQSPLTIGEWLKQRRRWLYTYHLVALAPEIELKYKLFIVMRYLSWVTIPLGKYLLNTYNILGIRSSEYRKNYGIIVL